VFTITLPLFAVSTRFSEIHYKCQYSLLNISIHLFYLTPALREAHAAVFRSGGGVEVLRPAGATSSTDGSGGGPKTENFNNFLTKFSKIKRVVPGTGASFARIRLFSTSTVLLQRNSLCRSSDG